MRIDARSLHPLQRLGDRHLAPFRKKRDLDHGERLDVDLRKPFLQAAHQIHEVFKRKIRMQAANDVELGDRLDVTGTCSLPRLLERHRVGARLTLLTAKGAQPAGRDADIRRIDVPVYVEVGNISMQLLAHVIREPADGQNVATAIESNAVVKAETLTGQHLLGDRTQSCDHLSERSAGAAGSTSRSS